MENWVTHTAYHEGAGVKMMWSKGHYILVYSDGAIEEEDNSHDMKAWEEYGWIFEEINFTLENE